MDILIKTFLCILAFLGIVMTSLGLPGNTLLLMLFVIYAFLGNFAELTLNNLAVIASLYLLGELWEFVVGYLGIKKEKITWCSVIIIGIGTFLGALGGTIVLPILGSIVGASIGSFVTAFFVEYLGGSGQERAFRVAWVATKNHFLAFVGKLIFGYTIFIMFIYVLFFK